MVTVSSTSSLYRLLRGRSKEPPVGEVRRRPKGRRDRRHLEKDEYIAVDVETGEKVVKIGKRAALARGERIPEILLEEDEYVDEYDVVVVGWKKRDDQERTSKRGKPLRVTLKPDEYENFRLPSSSLLWCSSKNNSLQERRPLLCVDVGRAVIVIDMSSCSIRMWCYNTMSSSAPCMHVNLHASMFFCVVACSCLLYK